MKSGVFAACVCLIAVTTARAGEPEVAFLRERLALTTSSGVVGFPPGTPVMVVSRHGPRVTVKSEVRQFEVSADQLITDAEAARSLRARDAAEQRIAPQRIQQQQQSAQQVAAQREAQLRDMEQRRRQAASPLDHKAALEAQIHDVRKQREKLEIELDRVHAD